MKALSAALLALLVNTVAHSAPQYRLTEISMDFYNLSYIPHIVDVISR